MGRRGGKKAKKQRENKQARVHYLSQLSNNANESYGYSSCVFICGCRIVEHIDNFRAPFDPNAISSWPINKSDIPRSMTEGCHFDNEFFFVDTTDDDRCPACTVDKENDSHPETTSWESSSSRPRSRLGSRPSSRLGPTTYSKFRNSPNYNLIYHPERQKMYRRPVVRSTIIYRCGHTRKERDWQ